MKASLASSSVSDGVITCNWHHWKYDLKTGECLDRPGMKLKRYDVEVIDGDVYVVL